MVSECIDHGCKGMGLGYATAWIKVGEVKKPTTKHRAVYYAKYGELPEVVEHTCNNPRCINIEHLKAGTHKSNAQYKLQCKREGEVARPGINNGMAKLNDDMVRYLRQMYIKGDKSWGASAIAKRLGMGTSSTHRMLEGKAWSHVN